MMLMSIRYCCLKVSSTPFGLSDSEPRTKKMMSSIRLDGVEDAREKFRLHKT